MQDMSDKDRKEALGEVLFDELRAIREGIADLPTRTEFNVLKDDVDELKADVKAIKAVVTEHSVVIKDHGQRITTLETA